MGIYNKQLKYLLKFLVFYIIIFEELLFYFGKFLESIFNYIIIIII